MSAYENPQIPEGINVSPTHPLKDFTLLLGGVSALIVVDDENFPVGLVHFHDLLRIGVA